MTVSAAWILTAVWNDYTKGRTRPGSLMMHVSEEMFEEYKAGLMPATREVPDDYPVPAENTLCFKTARVRVDPALAGNTVIVTEEPHESKTTHPKA